MGVNLMLAIATVLGKIGHLKSSVLGEQHQLHKAEQIAHAGLYGLLAIGEHHAYVGLAAVAFAAALLLKE